jgi:hypothetical protein
MRDARPGGTPKRCTSGAPMEGARLRDVHLGDARL